MTGLERDALYALKGIHEQLKRIADHYEVQSTQQNQDISELRNEIVTAIYTHRRGT